MTSINQRFFETNDEKIVESYNKEGISFDFKSDNKYYYSINSIESISEDSNNDENDIDIDDDFSLIDDSAIKKMNSIAEAYLKSGLKEIKYEDYKAIEKAVKEAKEKPFLENFSKEEKLVYQKTKEIINEYDLSSSDKVSFLMSLRKSVINETEFSIYSLEHHADKNRKNIDEIFEIGHQEMIVQFFNDLVEEVKLSKRPKVKI